MPTRVGYLSETGRNVEGELALPGGDGGCPALVLVQEWWGVNDNIRAYADRYAAEGFLTLAVDLYDGAVTTDREEASHRMGELDWPRALDHIAGAVAFLAAHPRSNGNVGITGFCMGGALTLSAASHVAGLSAAVAFYGVPGDFDAAHVTAPVLLHFASRDTWATPDEGKRVARELGALGKHATLEVYEADHAFMNMARPEVYDAACATRAWSRTIAFLRRHLAPRAARTEALQIT
jgi:carboxymethylenebutenolidase